MSATKILKNQTVTDIELDFGVTVPGSGQVTILATDYADAAASDDLVTFIGSGDIVVNDGSNDLSISQGMDLIKGLSLLADTTTNGLVSVLDDSGTKRFAVDIGGIQALNPQVSAQCFAPFSPWSASPGNSAFVPFESTQYETQLGMHDPTLDVSSTATSGAASTLTDTSQTWTVDEWAGAVVKITGGTGEGQWKNIVSNTVDTLTISGSWDTTPDATSQYYVSLNNSKLTAPIGGVYSVKGHVSISYQAGPVGIFFYVNGAFKALHYTHQGQNIELNGYFSRDFNLQTGDFVQMAIRNSAGIAYNMFGGEFRLWLSMSRQGG